MTLTDDKILINIESTSKEEEDHDEDPEELERITHNLRDELTEIDTIEKVDLVTKERKAPKGSKAGAEVIALGSLLVTLGTSAVSTAIPNLSNALQSWLTRHERRKISLEIGGDKIEVTGVSDEQQQQLIKSWLSNHSSSKEQKKGSTTDGS
jgi:23S rRNA pseudoU1915 N3-methylase RlmH